MGVTKRIVMISGAILVTAFAMSLGGMKDSAHVADLLTLVLVLGLTLVLGLLTYDPKRLWAEIRKIFSKGNTTGPADRRMLAQLALYALAAAVTLAVVQVLMIMTADNWSNCNTGSRALRMPFITMLYGVLTAVGLWVVSGLNKPWQQGQQRGGLGSTERDQIIVSFCVLLLMVGVLATLIVGMNRLANRTGGGEQFEAASGAVQGLQQGADMVWRPIKKDRGKSKAVTIESTAKNRTEKPIMISDRGHRSTGSMPLLRWEVQIKPDLTQPAVKQVDSPPAPSTSRRR